MTFQTLPRNNMTVTGLVLLHYFQYFRLLYCLRSFIIEHGLICRNSTEISRMDVRGSPGPEIENTFLSENCNQQIDYSNFFSPYYSETRCPFTTIILEPTRSFCGKFAWRSNSSISEIETAVERYLADREMYVSI